MQQKDVPGYLSRIINSYLDDRTLTIGEGTTETKLEVTFGVPQGSVIGPTLWNVLYDGLLQTRLPLGVEYLNFNVAIVAKARDSIKLDQLLSTAAQTTSDWLKRTGLTLAEEKCEAIVITKSRTYNDINVRINGHAVSSEKHIKYLGVHIDSKWRFN